MLSLLRNGIDLKIIRHEDFSEFLLILDDKLDKLPLLLGILYQNENLLRDSSIDGKLAQIRVNFLLLRCEQNAESLSLKAMKLDLFILRRQKEGPQKN